MEEYLNAILKAADRVDSKLKYMEETLAEMYKQQKKLVEKIKELECDKGNNSER